MKIRIRRANTTQAYTLCFAYLPRLGDYIDELRQQAKWESEK
jgi:hypothetical protein